MKTSYAEIVDAVRASVRERDRQILDKYAAGVSLDAIASEFGLSRQRVHQIVRATNATSRRSLAKIRDDEILSLARSGMTIGMIGSHMNLSIQTVSAVLQRYGVRAVRQSCRHSTVDAVCMMLTKAMTMKEIEAATGVSQPVLNALAKRIRDKGYKLATIDGRTTPGRLRREQRDSLVQGAREAVLA